MNDEKQISGEKVTENIYLCPDGKYRWVYEFKMLKNPMILFTVLKVMGLSALIVAVFVLVIDLVEDGRITPPASGQTKVLVLVILFMILLTVLSYVILAALYGWKYFVLFEMDEKQIVHIQMPKQVELAQAVGWLTVMAGIAAGRPSVIGTGLISSSKYTSTSVYTDIRNVIGVRPFHTIKLNQLLDRNQVYAEEADYDFVWNYISQRCVNAKIR